MRTRIGNPSSEAHGQPMRVIDWIAPAGTDPTTLPAAVGAALGVTFVSRALVHGFISTSLRPDGSVYVAVHLYDVGCANPACGTGHGATVLQAAPSVEAKRAAMVTAVGEHATHRLTGGTGDVTTLKTLGFATAEEKLHARGHPVKWVDAISAQCEDCGKVAFTDGPLR